MTARRKSPCLPRDTALLLPSSSGLMADNGAERPATVKPT
jgi:hypothetical protein